LSFQDKPFKINERRNEEEKGKGGARRKRE
jgi:hypothetical protein